MDGGRCWRQAIDGLYVVEDAVDLHSVLVHGEGLVTVATRVGTFQSGDRGRRWKKLPVPALREKGSYCRVLGQGPTVLLFTDGLERDADEDLAVEMDRLHRSSRRLIWLNPLLRFDGFQARARGVKAMLPHVDEFRSVHNLDALADLCASLDKKSVLSVDPRRWMEAGARHAA